MSIHPLQSLLQQFEWQSHFDPRTLQRARGYANSGHVLTLEYEPVADSRDDSIGVLTGSIAGNRPRP